MSAHDSIESPAVQFVGGADLLRAFTAISRALNLDQPLSYTLNLIAEKVSQTLGHKYCAILLCHDETKDLLIEGAYGLPLAYIEALNSHLKQRVDGDSVMARSVTAQAFRTRMPVYIHDVTADERFRPWREAALTAGYRAIVALPLIFRGKTIGVLNCYDEPRHYAESQVEALMIVAEQTASAVGIARLVLEQQQTIEQLQSLHERATHQQQVLQRSEKIHEALTALLLQGGSLDTLTATLAELLDAPITLQDVDLHVLSHADRPFQTHVELHAGPPRVSDIEAQLTALRESGRAVRVQWDSEHGHPVQAQVAHVAGGPYEHAYLTIPAGDDPGEESFYVRVLEQAATIYSLYLVKYHVAQEAEERIRGDLLTDLMAGRFRSVSEVYERARYLGVDLRAASHRLLITQPEALVGYLERRRRDTRDVGYLRGTLLAAARGFIARIGPGIATAIDEDIVMLVPAASGEEPADLARLFLAVVERALPDLHLRIGVSAPCLQPQDFSPRGEETWALLDLAARLDSPDPVICYDDWAFYGLLLRAGRREDVTGLAHRVLDRLVARDSAARGVLLVTLVAYLDYNLCPIRTGAALYVHPNTVKYRVKQISALLKLDLDSLDNILMIKVSLMVRSLAPDRFDQIALMSQAP